MSLTFGSLFAGIGGFDLGLERAGMTQAFAVECDRQCNTIRRRHWPNEETHKDVQTFSIRSTHKRPDLLCGGFPCQDLSVAGRRAGLAGERSGLFHEAARIIGEFAPTWILLENVPGLLSSASGRDMGTVLGTLAKLGYGTAYRVLNSQWFGVPQRRRRVFIVGCFGNWRRSSEILFERESLPWDSPPRREAGAEVTEGVAGCLNSGGNDGGFRSEPGEHLVAFHPKASVTQSMNPSETCPTIGTSKEPAIAYQCHGSNVGPMGHLRKGNGNETGGVPFVFTERTRNDGANVECSAVANALLNPGRGGRADERLLCDRMMVRRLTPRECERLQSIPDDWTRYGHDGKEISDSARYRMLGNAVTVNVIEWIGKRIIGAHNAPSPT